MCKIYYVSTIAKMKKNGFHMAGIEVDRLYNVCIFKNICYYYCRRGTGLRKRIWYPEKAIKLTVLYVLDISDIGDSIIITIGIQKP